MTVIAWDGKTLAADKASTNAGRRSTTTKIYRVPGGVVGFAGDADKAMDLLQWFRNGRDVTKYPDTQKDGGADALFVDDKSHIYKYDKSPHPARCEDAFTAMGSGRDYALAAMHLGLSAKRAVEVACALDCYCGNGIDTLELEA